MRLHLNLFIFGICNSTVDQIVLAMGEAYPIRDQEMLCFLTFQAVGWAAVFSKKVYRNFIMEYLSMICVPVQETMRD